MRKGWFALLGLMLWLMPDLHGEILGDVLAAHNVALDVLTVRERQQPITSFAVSAAEFPFLIAYYDDDGTGTLPAVLHVFRYDARIRALSRTDLRGEGVASAGRGGLMRYLSDTCMGSALAVSERNGFVTIQTHINPSAGCVLILTSDLKWTAGLWGWVLAPVGKMLLFEENTIHFAPVHSARIALYDPRRRQIIPVYPGKVDPERARFSAALRKHLPSSRWCAEHNLGCDPEDFSSDISHVEVGKSGDSFAFDVRMEAEGFGEDIERYVEPKTVHYVCKRRDAGCRDFPEVRTGLRSITLYLSTAATLRRRRGGG